jgi:XTP/dITP diphosphohydrolase
MKNPFFPTIVVATRNQGKLLEFRSLLLPLKSEILCLSNLSINEEFEETGQTFAENARIKAIGYSLLIPFPVLADDSGLEVAALGGRPGVYSARYAGPDASDSDRVQKLLAELARSGGGREARFVCALALAQEGILLHESQGQCSGIMAGKPQGTGGFGYDPVFFFPSLGKTFAQFNKAEKNQYSHRAQAVAALLPQLQPISIVNRQS